MSDNRISESVEFLAFAIGGEPFAADISGVREVVKQVRVTEVPGMPDYLPGVVNLRGEILSIIDLRMFLQPDAERKTAGDSMIVAEVECAEGRFQIGMMVDSVSGVVQVGAERVCPPPDIGANIPPEFVRGLLTMNESFMIIPDIGKIITAVLERQMAMADTIVAGISAN